MPDSQNTTPSTADADSASGKGIMTLNAPLLWWEILLFAAAMLLIATGTAFANTKLRITGLSIEGVLLVSLVARSLRPDIQEVLERWVRRWGLWIMLGAGLVSMALLLGADPAP